MFENALKGTLNNEVSITENPDNTDGIYKLDISYTSKGEDVSFTTPNLKGGLNNLYDSAFAFVYIC